MPAPLPPLTYLTVDALGEGVGASQVLAYTDRLAARGLVVRLHSFEKEPPTAVLRDRVRRSGVIWTPHVFGRHGTVGGVVRLLEGARAVRGASLVHARSDLAAASVMLSSVARWVWDVRSLWIDQRLDLGTLRAGSPQERILRKVERQAALRSSAIVTLTDAVIPVLEARHGGSLAAKTTVVTTCVDTARFPATPLPPPSPLRLLLAGTINRYYDVPAMVSLVELARARRPTELTLVTPGATAWDDLLAASEVRRRGVEFDDMPAEIAACHAGLSVCRSDVGISRVASMPTKIGEFLSCGRPVIVNDGLGDASELVSRRGCGVVVKDTSPSGLELVLDQLEALLADPETPERCRSLALEHFDLDRGVDRLIEVYRDVVALS